MYHHQWVGEGMTRDQDMTVGGLPSTSGWLAFDQLAANPDIAESWRHLAAAAFMPTQLPSYARGLAATMVPGQVSRLLYSTHGDMLGAVLPLVRAGGPWARWRLLGAGELFEPGDVLALGPGAVTVLARALLAQGRPVVLARVPVGSGLGPALAQAMRGRGLVTIRPAKPCPTILLDARWRDPVSRFNAGRRSDFRRAQRRAEKMGALSYELLSPTPATIGAVLDEAIGIEGRGWKTKAGTALGADQLKQAFFRQFFADAAADGTMRAAFLRIDGRAVAMQLAMEMQGRYWLFKIGYDEAYARCSPGNLLMAYTIGEAAARGLAAYELLGQAESWIVQGWTQAAHECLCIRTYPLSLGGGAALVVDGLHWLAARVAGCFAR